MLSPIAANTFDGFSAAFSGGPIEAPVAFFDRESYRVNFPLLLAAAPLKRQHRRRARRGYLDFPLLLAAAPLKRCNAAGVVIATLKDFPLLLAAAPLKRSQAGRACAL